MISWMDTDTTLTQNIDPNEYYPPGFMYLNQSTKN